MQRINEMLVDGQVRLTKKLEKLVNKKDSALSTVEIILLIIVIIGIVAIFATGARTFVTELWTTITTKANGMFS